MKFTRRTFLQTASAAAFIGEAGETIVRSAIGDVPSPGLTLDDLLAGARGGFVRLTFDGVEVREEALSILQRDGFWVTVGISAKLAPRFTFRVDENPAYLGIHLINATGDFSKRDTGLVFRCHAAPPLEAFTLDYMGRNESSGGRLQLAWPFLWNLNQSDPLGAFAIIRSGLTDQVRDRALAAIWAEGTLPHPAVDEPWTIGAVERWVTNYCTKFSGLSETTLSAANAEELSELSGWLHETGCRRVYLHTDTWRQEYWPRRRSFVAVNPAVFPGGREDLRRYRSFLQSKGMLLRLHNVSAGIGLQDPEFVQNGIDPRIAVWVDGHLEMEATLEAKELYFRPAAGFRFPHLDLRPHWNLKRFRVGREIVEVADIEEVDGPVWRLHPVRRGVGGATASPHRKGTPVAGLLCAYGQNYVPDNSSSLLTLMAERYAALVNEAQLDHQHFDGAEIHAHKEPWGFDKLSYLVAGKVNRATTTSTSGGLPTKWNFELNFSQIRGLKELGYWAASIPVLLAGHRNASSWLDAHYEIASRLLRPARRLGFQKPEPMFGVNVEALRNHGLMPQYVELFRDWVKVIPAIGETETEWLRRHLKPVQGKLAQRGRHEQSRDVPVLVKSNDGYSLVPTRVLVLDHRDAPWLTGQEFGPIGPRQYLTPGEVITVYNPYKRQAPGVILQVLSALEDRPPERGVAAGNQSADRILEDYRTGTLVNADPVVVTPLEQDAEPTPSLWPTGSEIRASGDTRLVLTKEAMELVADNPSGQEIWEEQDLPSWPCRLPLRGRRGLEIEVLGDGSGATLVCQLHSRGVRDYVVKLDFTGVRRIIIPHGEASWAAACWGWRFGTKHFDYDGEVVKVSLGFGFIPPRCTARVSVRSLRLLENVSVPLREATIRVGEGSLRVRGEVTPHEYLTYEPDAGVRVFDRNWRFLRSLESQAHAWGVDTGEVKLSVEHSLAPLKPWLEVQILTRGEPFPIAVAVRAEDRGRS